MNYITCKELIDFINDYRDGALDPAARKKFDEHLGVCPPCRDYLRMYEDTIRLSKDALNDPKVPKPPESLIKAILNARRTSN